MLCFLDSGLLSVGVVSLGAAGAVCVDSVDGVGVVGILVVDDNYIVDFVQLGPSPKPKLWTKAEH